MVSPYIFFFIAVAVGAAAAAAVVLVVVGLLFCMSVLLLLILSTVYGVYTVCTRVYVSVSFLITAIAYCAQRSRSSSPTCVILHSVTLCSNA